MEMTRDGNVLRGTCEACGGLVEVHAWLGGHPIIGDCGKCQQALEKGLRSESAPFWVLCDDPACQMNGCRELQAEVLKRIAEAG